MADPFIAEIVMFGGNFAPRAWSFCDNNLLAISSNTALFSLLGCTYGGDCRTTFALPDMRGRAPVHQGSGPGLTPRQLGERGGQESVVLATSQMPSHNHSVSLHAEVGPGTSGDPENNMIAFHGGGTGFKPYNANEDKNMAPQSIRENNVGSNLAHTNLHPFSVVNFIIALQGVFPSRN